MNVEWDSVDIRSGGEQIEQVEQAERRTGQDLQRFPVHLQQYHLEFSILFNRYLDVPPLEGRLLLPEVFESLIQLSEDVIEPLDENLPMVPHPNSTKVFPNRGTDYYETMQTNGIPLRPDEEEV